MTLNFLSQSLHKEERLCSKKSIATLFKQGKTKKTEVIKLTYLYSVEVMFPQALFYVAKAKMPKAHMRNLIRRRMREAYRINKNILYNYNTSKWLGVLFRLSYDYCQLTSFVQIEAEITKLLNYVREKFI